MALALLDPVLVQRRLLEHAAEIAEHVVDRYVAVLELMKAENWSRIGLRAMNSGVSVAPARSQLAGLDMMLVIMPMVSALKALAAPATVGST